MTCNIAGTGVQCRLPSRPASCCCWHSHAHAACDQHGKRKSTCAWLGLSSTPLIALDPNELPLPIVPLSPICPTAELDLRIHQFNLNARPSLRARSFVQKAEWRDKRRGLHPVCGVDSESCAAAGHSAFLAEQSVKLCLLAHPQPTYPEAFHVFCALHNTSRPAAWYGRCGVGPGCYSDQAAAVRAQR